MDGRTITVKSIGLLNRVLLAGHINDFYDVEVCESDYEKLYYLFCYSPELEKLQKEYIAEKAALRVEKYGK